MTYVPTVWTDEILAGAPKYSVTGDVEGELSASAVIQLVTGVTAGTPLNATNLNKFEQGLVDLETLLNAITGVGISGTYTPGISGMANLSQGPSIGYASQYVKVGNVITVSGSMYLVASDPELLVRFTIDLPIATGISSLIESENQLSGIMVGVDTDANVPIVGRIRGEPNSNVAQAEIWCADSIVSFTLSYEYIEP